jgi:hypothetical protein
MCAKSQSASDRLNESLKRLHDLQNHARVHGERVLYARSVLKHSFVDGYAKKELSLILHAHVARESDVIGEGLSGAPGIPSLDDAVLILRYDASDVPVGFEGNQEAVFVSFVENVDFPDGKIPSVVRAYLIKHQIKKPWAGDVYFSAAQGCFKIFPSWIDSELSKGAESGRGGSLNSFDPRIIEGAFEIVDGIANHQGGVGKKFISVHDIVNENLIGKLRVNLDSRNVTVWQIGEPFFQFTDVFIGPLDLCSGIAKLHARS